MCCIFEIKKKIVKYVRCIKSEGWIFRNVALLQMNLVLEPYRLKCKLLGYFFPARFA